MVKKSFGFHAKEVAKLFNTFFAVLKKIFLRRIYQKTFFIEVDLGLKIAGNDERKTKDKPSSKRQLTLDWGKSSISSVNLEESRKKPKCEMNTGEMNEKHVCLQCLELSLQGKHEERFASICRLDSFSIQRHKGRWHKLLERKACTFVPASSPAASRIRDKYKNHGRLYDSKKQQTYNTKESKDPQCETTTTAELNQRTQQHLVSEIPSRQTTLLDLKASDKSSLSEGASLKQCLDAISALSIKVDNISSQTSTLKHLACENTETRDSIIEIKESDNIIQMNDATPLLERFYDEDTECGVLRCAPCYELHVAAKPTLRSLTPFRANQLLNPKGNGTLSTGIFFNKETSQHLIRGRHHVWYHHKRRCIDHLCLVGSESSKHHKAMDEYMKKKEELKRETTACRNLFRAAIADLKLGAAAKHLETLLSLLACCSVDIGKMGHGRNNFNDIIYCLEKVIDGKIKSCLPLCLVEESNLPFHFASSPLLGDCRQSNAISYNESSRSHCGKKQRWQALSYSC